MSSFTDCASVIGLPDSFELAINRKKTVMSQLINMRSSSICLMLSCLSCYV